MPGLSPASLEQLKGAHLVDGMSDEQIQTLGAYGSVESYGDGESVIRLDDDTFDLWIMLEGKCEIRTQMDDMLYRLGPSTLIGEVSFLDHNPRSAKAIAVGECKVIRFPAGLLDDLGEKRPEIAAKLLKNIGVVLCQKLRSTTRFAEACFV